MFALFTQSKLFMWGAFGALFLAMGLGGFLSGRHIEAVEQELKTVKAVETVRIQMQAKVDKERNRLDTLSTQLEVNLAKLQPIFTTINRKVEKEIVEKKVYTELACTIPESGVEIINRSATQLNQARKENP